MMHQEAANDLWLDVVLDVTPVKMAMAALDAAQQRGQRNRKQYRSAVSQARHHLTKARMYWIIGTRRRAWWAGIYIDVDEAKQMLTILLNR